MPVPGDMPEEVITENGWIIRRPGGEYVLMVDRDPEDWGADCRAEIEHMAIRITARKRTKAFLRRIDPRVTAAIRAQHHLKIIVGCEAMQPILNTCEVAGGDQA